MADDADFLLPVTNSVLPPPPRYPSQMGYNGTPGAGHIIPMIETNNILTTPTGPEYQFLVGEGLYVLKEDLHLATPPPHPSEAPITNPNPLATTPQPATVGTRVTLINLDVGPLPPSFYRVTSRSEGPPGSIQEHPDESGKTSSSEIRSSTSDGGRLNSTDAPPSSNTNANNAPAFGEGNTLLAPATSKDASKKRKPKNNMSKSNSSFISRVINHENLTKKLQDRARDGLFAFANINRAFQWLDLSSPSKQEYLTKILFTKAHCLCHDINKLTKSSSHIDVIMGFSTGEIIWWEPITQRYTRLNKNGVINKTPVSEIRWIPGSEHLFLAAHMDGSLVVYDKEKEDAIFTAEDHDPRPSQDSSSSSSSASKGDQAAKNNNTNNYYYNNNNNNNNDNNASAGTGFKIQIHKSVHSKSQKTNPIAVWKLSNQRINAFAFSPDNRHLAVVSEDGSLRIIDYLTETLLDLFYSYYGGLTCVCWSPDGKYVLTGGQDDLISIWCPEEKQLIARCQGHRSWVTSVAFDPWRCDDRVYRFGSVGEDCRICLWDFGVGMLHRPKLTGGRGRGISVSSANKGMLVDGEINGEEDGARRNKSGGGGGGGGKGGVIPHEVEPRATVAMLPPVLSKVVDDDPLCWLEFTEDAVMTSCKSGHVRTWLRPKEGGVLEEEKKEF